MRDDLRSDVRWTTLLAVAIVVVAMMLVLADPLAQLLVHPGSARFFPSVQWQVDPKGPETVRYVLAVLAALLLPLLLSREMGRLPPALVRRPKLIRATALIAKLTLAGVVLWALIAEYHGVLNRALPRSHFSPAALVAAVVIAAAALLIVRARPRWVAPARAPARPRRRTVLWAPVAVLLTACWLAPDFYRGQNLADALSAHNILFTWGDGFLPLLDGRTPLVHFDSQYTSLLGYVGQPVFAIFGAKVGTFSALMCALSLIAFIAVERTLVLVARSERLALALFVPFLAVSLQTLIAHGDDRVNFGNYYAVFPLRYLGPYLLLYVCARHLSGARPRGRIPVFALAGLVAVNNLEFGVPALAASAAALSCNLVDTRAALLRLIRDALLGVAVAVVIVVLGTLARSGQLPELSRLTRYPTLFGVSGFLDLPTPTAGLHLIVYLTFAGALILVAQRVRARDPDRTYTGILAYSGIFGLGAGAYYMGRSHPNVLVAVFSAWALCVALLALRALRIAAAARSWSSLRRIAVAAPLLMLGLIATRVTEFPAPWTELRRIAHDDPRLVADRSGAVAFVRRTSRSGASVVVLDSLGFLTAHEAGVTNVTPYTHPVSIVTYDQLDEVISALRRSGGTRLYLAAHDDDPFNLAPVYPEIPATLARRGFVVAARDPASELTEWVLTSPRAPSARRTAPSR